ncbi:MAG: hypothetical protein JO250_24655 [Armatimonadetes bacterium]|nr:hypothetical protein [Armatimonadota bacterium]
MSSLFEMAPELQEKVSQEAHQRHMAPEQMLDYLIRKGLDSLEQPVAPSAQEAMQEQLAALKDQPVLQSLDELKPRVPPPPGKTAMQMIRGQWPGDETEEELLAAQEAMD